MFGALWIFQLTFLLFLFFNFDSEENTLHGDGIMFYASEVFMPSCNQNLVKLPSQILLCTLKF